MMRRKATLMVVLGVGIALFVCSCSWSPEFRRDGSKPADLVVANARIITSNPEEPSAEALAVKDERFTYVGTDEGVADYVGPDTEVIDAEGRTIIPGFVDNHCHVLWIGGLYGLMTSLYDATSFDEAKATMVKFAEENPENPFVMGVGWNYNYIPGGLPTREMADSIISDRPMMLMSYGGNTGWVNTKAFNLMRERNPGAFHDLMPGVVEEGGEDKYTGLFMHFHAVNPFDYFIDEEMGPEIKEKMYKAISKLLNEGLKYGVTAFNDVQIYMPFMPMLLKFKERGGLDNVRARLSLYVGGHALEDEEALKEELKVWQELGKEHSDSHLRFGESVKLYIEGVASTHTALMLEPYSDEPDNYGEAVWSQDDFNRVVKLIDGMGMQCCTHACADGGIRRVVNAYENAREVNGKRDSRHRVEHGDQPHPDEIFRMGKLGIYVATQPAHFYGYGDESIVKILGEKRLNMLHPWQSYAKAGVNLSFGSDWCTSPYNPIYGLLISGERINSADRTDISPDEKVDIETAIMNYTIGSAKAMFMEDEIGSIEVGKFADFAVFNIDLLDITSLWFLLTHDLELGAMDDFVDMTFVGGKTVYKKKD